MKKIPTLFQRDPNNRSRVLNKLAVELPANAQPTAKWDGSCVMYDGHEWWKRREVKAGKSAPDDFYEVHFDEVTGKRQGWVPVTDGPEDQWFRAAIEDYGFATQGTFEAVGPHFQGNPHRLAHDQLRQHGSALLPWSGIVDQQTLHHLLSKSPEVEGIVWWHHGEPVAKLKRRDFGLVWPVKP